MICDARIVIDGLLRQAALKKRFPRELQVHGSGTVPAAMALVRSVTTPTGVVFSVYRRAGALKTGSFELPEK